MNVVQGRRLPRPCAACRALLRGPSEGRGKQRPYTALPYSPEVDVDRPGDADRDQRGDEYHGGTDRLAASLVLVEAALLLVLPRALGRAATVVPPVAVWIVAGHVAAPLFGAAEMGIIAFVVDVRLSLTGYVMTTRLNLPRRVRRHVGAVPNPITDATRATGARIAEAGVQTTVSVCPYCAVGCSLLVYTKDGQLLDIEGNPASPINGGALCPKGAATS